MCVIKLNPSVVLFIKVYVRQNIFFVISNVAVCYMLIHSHWVMRQAKCCEGQIVSKCQNFFSFFVATDVTIVRDLSVLSKKYPSI